MEEREIDYINVIPFVDIMLVLLAIVLTTSTFIASGGLPVNLPRASKDHDEVRMVVIVEMDRNGAIYFNHEPVTEDGLRRSLATMDRAQPILIRADRDIVLQEFVDVLDLIKGLGYTKVSLQTETRR